jgi:hypothetical protein
VPEHPLRDRVVAEQVLDARDRVPGGSHQPPDVDAGVDHPMSMRA